MSCDEGDGTNAGKSTPECSSGSGHGFGATSPSRRIAQAIDALRHGWPLKIAGAPLLLPVETGFGPDARSARLLISGARAAGLKLANQRAAALMHAPVLIRATGPLDLAAARPISDPALDLAVPLKGPFRAEPLAWQDQAEVALDLAREAGILPAFLVDPSDPGEPVPLASSDLAAWQSSARLVIAARAQLPIETCDEASIVAFRKPDDMREHVALIIGNQRGEHVPVVRLHSECLTGDVFASARCDCGPQLDAALEAMTDEAAAGGFGIILYMRQEGRGIGLVNKLRAYRLQEQGFDTLEANARLGLPEEARDFPAAARMLELLGVRAVRLLTNNPAKVTALEAAGIEVTDRIAHALPAGPHNARYLATKRDRAGHLL